MSSEPEVPIFSSKSDEQKVALLHAAPSKGDCPRKCSDRICGIRFSDPSLERNYGAYFVQGRRQVVSALSLTVVVFSVVVFLVQYSTWTSWQGKLPLVKYTDMFFWTKMISQLSLAIIFSVTGIVINVRGHSSWGPVSSAMISLFVAVSNLALLVSSFVGVKCYILVSTTCAVFSDGTACVPVDNVTIADFVDTWNEVVTSAISTNTASMMVAPVFALVFSAPMRTYLVCMAAFVVCIIVPNIAIVVTHNIQKLGFAEHERNLSKIATTNGIAIDLAYEIVSQCLQAAIILTISLHLSMNFDKLLRSGFLLRHVIQQERNDLSAKANPFAPNELERWFKAKQRTIQLENNPSQNSLRTKSVSSDSNFSWDLNPKDLRLGDTIASGTAGRVIAGAYNGLEVAIKVRPRDSPCAW